MNYIGALAVEGQQFYYKTNERLHKAARAEAFEDQKDSIKLTSLVSSVVDRDTQEKIDVVKTRLIKDYGYCDDLRDRRPALRGEHLRARRREGLTAARDAGGTLRRRRRRRTAARPSGSPSSPMRIDTDHTRFRQIVRGTHPQGAAALHVAGRS